MTADQSVIEDTISQARAKFEKKLNLWEKSETDSRTTIEQEIQIKVAASNAKIKFLRNTVLALVVGAVTGTSAYYYHGKTPLCSEQQSQIGLSAIAKKAQ